jgi:hypothetical protein
MNIFGAIMDAVITNSFECCCRVCNERDIKPQVFGHTHRSRNTMSNKVAGIIRSVVSIIFSLLVYQKWVLRIRKLNHSSGDYELV